MTSSMKAVTLRRGELEVIEAPVPKPGPGDVLVKVLAAGICGSDLHSATHGQELIDSTRAVAGFELFDPENPIVMGHEYCAEVVEYGEGTRGEIPIGSRVTSVPFLLRGEQPILIGYAGVESPGAYAEYMLLSEDLMIPVPDSVPSDIAALAEPLAVAVHAVNRGGLGADDVPIVIGCGPIGLAVIKVLKLRGIGPIIAADFSPARRALAAELGADIVVDPRVESPYEAWKDAAAVGETERFGRQTTMFPGFAYRPSVVFECVGVPGVLQQIFAGAAPCTKVVVAGLCMEEDRVLPTYALLKEIDMVFCMAYSVEEFIEALGYLSRDDVNIAPFITSRIGYDDVPEAFSRLADPEQDAKIVIMP
ncbi:zinc-binding dehydrogenase [Aeromicrobium ginsengisoli]|nr:zinc-binding dehydrogenase [Aeromicrobium ginsengisoli]